MCPGREGGHRLGQQCRASVWGVEGCWGARSLGPGTTAQTSDPIGDRSSPRRTPRRGDIALTRDGAHAGFQSSATVLGGAHPGRPHGSEEGGEKGWTRLVFGNKSDFQGRKNNVFVSVESELWEKKESSASVTLFIYL